MLRWFIWGAPKMTLGKPLGGIVTSLMICQKKIKGKLDEQSVKVYNHFSVKLFCAINHSMVRYECLNYLIRIS